MLVLVWCLAVLILLDRICTIYPHGSTDTLPFATIGSGSLATMAIFESKYREGLTINKGIKLVSEAICSGIFNDLGSGSNVDVCIITKVKVMKESAAPRAVYVPTATVRMAPASTEQQSLAPAAPPSALETPTPSDKNAPKSSNIHEEGDFVFHAVTDQSTHEQC
ncbi:uncharacterized protein LOC131253118 [Magnolia sinica]|uniref:uncharacterized protein LOC131253118 n=1 Tax=Magnolia sinica TaxID=86752 RepID=UPI00265B1435|nr:uncharacterized protein LOC131253118 [Magnolia sinica]